MSLSKVLKTSEVKNDGDEVVVVTDKGEFRFDALLYATGRKPNIEPLHLENTDIALTERGGIQVNKHFGNKCSWCLCSG